MGRPLVPEKGRFSAYLPDFEARSWVKCDFWTKLLTKATIARQQPQQLPIPFEQPAEDARVYSAKQHLDALGINQPQLVATILGDAKHLDQLFKFTYQLKTDKVKATKNPGGLFLKICGLR